MKNILISYFGYEHDQLDHKIQDRTFLSRFGKDQKTKGFLLKKDLSDIKRTDIWRPSVALASYPDLHFNEYYILYSGLRDNMQETFDEVVEDIHAISPQTTLYPEKMNFKSPWDMVSVFKALYKFAEDHASEFGAQDAHCYVNCNHGTMQIRESLFMLSQEGKFPGVRILPSPWHDNTKRDYHTPEGSYAIDDPSEFNEAYRQLSKDTKRRAKDNGLHNGIFIDKSNKEFLKLLDRILFVAQRTKEPILFTGPTGSGKTKLAENIAKILGKRFVKVNCATLSGDPGLIKSELFGHDKGDFTGADETREGRLQQANGGLLFLDEIAELPKDVQAMLLTAIEDKTFTRPHSTEEIKSDFMLICGTNKDLRTEVNEGRFRLDLLERINTWHLRLPGLAVREIPGVVAARRKDIALNCQQVMGEYNKKYATHLEFSNDALKRFVEYAESDTTEWKGNFREFNSMIFRMATLADGLQITVDDVEREIKYAEAEQQIADKADDAPAASTTQETNISTQPANEWASVRALDYSPLKKLIPDIFEDIEPVELVHLMYVVAVCRESRSLTDANMALRTTRNGKSPKGAPSQLSKYLGKFSLTFDKIRDFRF